MLRSWKKAISLILVFALSLTICVPMFAADNSTDNYDYAPVIGQFEFNAKTAAMIQKKSEQAEKYYEAKKNGNYSLAKQILLDKQSTKNNTLSSSSLGSTSNRLSIY